MGTHPIFESDFDCLTEVVMFKKLKDKTKEAAATAASNLTRSDSMNSLNSTNSGFSAASSSRTPVKTSRIQQSLQGTPNETKIRQLEAKLAERAVMIRKLEHERDKLSNQLEKSQEAASHAKKMAKEGEMAIKSATANCTRLENELNRLAQEKEINEENGDLAHQESAKLKHMLLIAENENQKLKQQLASTQAGDLENISSENAKLSTLNSRYSAEIEELKLAKLELDEQTTKQKYQIENFEAENRRLKAEHKELTEERRRLVDDRAKLAEEFEQKIKVISEFEKSNETNENELEQLNSRFLELEAENSNLLEKLEEAEQVNKRLREGNLKVQDHEREMSRDHEKMKASFEEMEVENKKCKELADRVKAEIIEVQRENETRRDESQKIESKLIEMSSESAYFKDLLEKGLVIRKDLERSVADERNARTKSEDALASAKTATERIQEELDIVSK